ncbi:Lon protease 2 [Polystyrenella longa]|uniref:endopeptidase La n=1 Tax=Polystyrenella longa TaxID=2528007 RepID=A0A518CKK7_9PLAN|nr:S16 family serine protease [Polystyrenella longa]QDU79757.1 Lon protease 2 [Polystyrenella longa]
MRQRLTTQCLYFMLLAFFVIGNSPSFAQEEERIKLSEVTVNALSYFEGPDGRAYGNCFPLQVTVGGKEAGRVRIGFYESEVGGSGEQWQAAGWMASLMAAQLTDFDPATTQVAFDIQGRVDGPSAGALMTIGILAAARGDKVRDDVAMTGTINPDGMIGPVGGIPHKIEGAAAKGMKLVLIPATAENEMDKNKKQMVNLIRHGAELGVEVKKVIDIYEAYALMTGTELPRPNISGRPTIDYKTDAVLASRIGQWADLTKTAIEKYEAAPEDARVEYSDLLIEEARDYIKTSEGLMKEGVITVAYTDMQYAALNAFLAKEVAYCNQTNLTIGYDAMLKRINNNDWLQAEIDKTAIALKFSQPTTMNQLALYLEACDAFIEAVSFQKLAAKTMANLPEDEDEAIEIAITASEWQVFGWLDCRVTMDFLELMRQYGGKPIPADAPFLDTAHFYRRTSEASYRVFESITVNEIAKVLKVAQPQAKFALAKKDSYFGLVTMAQTEVLPNLQDYFGDGPQFAYATLAGSIYVHLRASMLIAKYYSLNAQLDKEMMIIGIGREQALNEWLEASEEQARRNVMLLSRYGMDTATCAQNFEYCRLMKTRGLSDKLDALFVLLYLNTTTKVLQRLSGVKVDQRTGEPLVPSTEETPAEQAGSKQPSGDPTK